MQLACHGHVRLLWYHVGYYSSAGHGSVVLCCHCFLLLLCWFWWGSLYLLVYELLLSWASVLSNVAVVLLGVCFAGADTRLPSSLVQHMWLCQAAAIGHRAGRRWVPS
jgi:hypothetical protein